MTKQELLNSCDTVWNSMIDGDYEEYQDYLKENVPEMFDKEMAWRAFESDHQMDESVLGNYFNRLSKEEAWELYNPRTFSEIKEDKINRENLDKYEKHTLQIMQWHHIEPVNDPYWRQCVNLIEEKLNGKL